MKTLTAGIYFSDSDGNIYSERKLSGNWTIVDEQDLQINHSECFFEEVAHILIENIKMSLTTEMVQDMLKEMSERKKT